ncbi:flavin reductase family protein [Halalkalibacter akibai]|uniref:Nitrilotriacetate monooxygenase component B n=1 Tax=Halalkalibacter akibai (strain ATCC 43226 / DSM 21942 / CIP 109018 / JCM 9157 / 1139) TaxID=1236973 RepID=W4QXB6_HALA3|nr:flavin reductase family protein [Halalkalibacter akibai]GAE35949.1 nitrilotriacetate monooxygenase component B [Halalkalibacter akibai JCM 9157]
MLTIDPNNLAERDNYKFLTGSIIPRPVALVTTLSKDLTLNAAPFSYFNIVSSNPPMISISVQRSNGEMKDTTRNAIFQKEFVVHIADESYVEQMNQTAKAYPASVSEVKEAKLTEVRSLKVKVPGIQEAKIRLECVLEQAVPLGGSGDTPACELLIGRVVQYHIHPDLYEQGRIDAESFRPISRLAGNAYSTLGTLFELERPK